MSGGAVPKKLVGLSSFPRHSQGIKNGFKRWQTWIVVQSLRERFGKRPETLTAPLGVPALANQPCDHSEDPSHVLQNDAVGQSSPGPE